MGLYCFNDWYVKSKNKIIKVQYFQNSFQPVGAGRFYTSKFLEEINFQLFDISLDKLLDDQGWNLLKRKKFHYDILNTTDSGSFISIKLGEQELNSFNTIESSDSILSNIVSNKDLFSLKNFLSDSNFKKYISLKSNFFY